jgi:hypothetical protein
MKELAEKWPTKTSARTESAPGTTAAYLGSYILSFAPFSNPSSCSSQQQEKEQAELIGLTRAILDHATTDDAVLQVDL